MREVKTRPSAKKALQLLVDRYIKRDLQDLVNVRSSSIAKLGKNKNVNTDILVRICTALSCVTGYHGINE